MFPSHMQICVLRTNVVWLRGALSEAKDCMYSGKSEWLYVGEYVCTIDTRQVN